MNQKRIWLSALLVSASAACGACGQPAAPMPATPAPAAPGAQPPALPTPAQPPAVAPVPAPTAPAEPQTITGPDGKKYTFPLPVYDESLDGRQQLIEAFDKAKREHKRVLVMWGENWCEFCIWLNHILKNDTSVAPLVESDFVWVKIDLGKQFGRVAHTSLAQQYQVPVFDQLKDGKGLGFPALSVIDPELNQTVGVPGPRGYLTGVIGGNDMTAKPMQMGHLFEEKTIREFLMTNKPPPVAAQKVFDEATTAAKVEGKKILALFTMPQCPDCEKIASWMDRADVAAATSSALVLTRIDIERMNGARELLKETAGKVVLPPLLIMLDEKGKPLGKDMQFTALPKTNEQIEAFLKAIGSAAKLGNADQAVLSKSLKDAALAKADEKKP